MYNFISVIFIIHLFIYLPICTYGYKNMGDFPKVTQTLYSGARQRTETRLSRVLITQYPLINVIRVPKARLHFKFKHSPCPPSIHV